MQLFIWQSNLHTYDASQFDEKSMATSANDTSCASKTSLDDASKASNDLSIRIDPRESAAYRALDEHFKVVESEHSKQLQPPMSYLSNATSPKFREHAKVSGLEQKLNTKYKSAPFFK